MSSGASVSTRIRLDRLPWDETHGTGRSAVAEPSGGSEESAHNSSDPREDPPHLGRIEPLP